MPLNDPSQLASESRNPKATILVGLAGQPNVGKSTVFNLLTGLSQHVGNWPGKTVERKEGMLTHNDMHLRIVDLPGTYSLTANSEEERITRDFVVHEEPDVIVMIADASALERNLYLLAELLVLPVPVVLGLNMMDVAQRQGIQIEAHVLEAALGLPVIPLVATKNEGVSQLIVMAERLVREPTSFRPNRPEIAEPHRDVLAQVRSLLNGQVPSPYQGDWVALKLLEGDMEITEKAQSWLPESNWASIADLLKEHEDAVLDIASGRYDWISRMVRAAVVNPGLGQISLTDRLDRIAVHPLWGLLLLLTMFALVFWVTFTVAAPIQHWLDVSVVERLQGYPRECAAVACGSPGPRGSGRCGYCDYLCAHPGCLLHCARLFGRHRLPGACSLCDGPLHASPRPAWQEFSPLVSRLRLQCTRRDRCARDRHSKRTASHDSAGALGTLQCQTADTGTIDPSFFR